MRCTRDEPNDAIVFAERITNGKGSALVKT
jgi:hypothetical protein